MSRQWLIPPEAPVTSSSMIVLGILVWVLIAILVALLLGRVNKLSSPRISSTELPPAPPVEKTVLKPMVGKSMVVKSMVVKPTVEAVQFPAEPTRFVGRAETLAAASTALAPASGRAAVVFHGMAGVGKTTCAVELAYRRQHDFGALAFWSAPTDPDQFDDALRLLAVALEAQLADYGFSMAKEIATQERLEGFLPTLTAVFADAGLLLVLDNLDILLTPDGQWRDLRWVPLIGALTVHSGPSRVILVSRIVPAGLNPDTVWIQPVHTLSRDESLWLARRLSNLRALLHTVALGRCLLTLSQGHPKLLEFADAAAVDPSRLAYQLIEIEAAMDGSTLAAFVTEGNTKFDAEQLMRTFTAWTLTVAATAPATARLLLQVLCRMEETDRSAVVVGANWAALWRRLDRPGEPPPLASPVAALVNAALITTDLIDDPIDPNGTLRYRIHPGVVEAIQTVIPERVADAVDAQLAAWWSAVADGWAIEPHSSEDSRQFTVRTSVAAARYLLRQHDWHTSSCLIERALIRHNYSPATSLAVIPLLRRIADGSGTVKDLVVLGAALRKLAPGEAELLLRRAYDRAATGGDYELASTTAGELVTLLRDQGRLREALTLVDQKIEHTDQAGFGFWTQVSDRGRRLQILNLLGHHEQVLGELPALRALMAELPDHRADNDRVNPSNAREGVLDIGRLSAMALERWDEALGLNKEIADARLRLGASPQQMARIWFNDYVPLLRLGRLADVDHLLRHCQHVFDPAGDITQLAVIYGARASLAAKRDHPTDAVDFQRASLRLRYAHPDPREISTAHHHLANYLSRAAGDPTEQRAHRLTAALISHLTENAHELTRTCGALAGELRSDACGFPTAARPTTVPEIIRLVDADNGVHFGNLLVTLCADPATAEHALADLLSTATTATD